MQVRGFGFGGSGRAEAGRVTGARVVAIVAVTAVVLGVFGSPIGAAQRRGGISGVSPSTDGVMAKSVTIVFPVVDLSAASGSAGLQYQSDEKDPLGIHTYVKAFNAAGGVNGRTINAKIVKFTHKQYSEPKSSALGAAGVERFRFKALKAGQATFTLKYSRPSAPDAPENLNYTYNVTVKAKS